MEHLRRWAYLQQAKRGIPHDQKYRDIREHEKRDSKCRPSATSLALSVGHGIGKPPHIK